MKTYVPAYYKKFCCIADRCRHSCCIGWEIDIDEYTLEMYENLPGEIGERIRDGIVYGDTPCFRLCEGARCHFLNERGLCEIILALGEEGLCDICADHPRFRNYFSDRCEMGLGLSCEEACRLILGDDDIFSLEVTDDDGEDDELSPEEVEFFTLRHEIFCRTGDPATPLSTLLSGTDTDPAEWAEFYRSLERLDSIWDKYLDVLDVADRFVLPEKWDKEARNLYRYFLYRHGGDCAHSLNYAAAFASHAVMMIFTLLDAVDGDFAELCEICRLYSSEIEYSTENTDAVIDKLK